MKDHILAIDIGGTKIASALITTSGELLYRHADSPTCQTGMEDGFKQVIDIINDIISTNHINKDSIFAIGVGIPAVLEKDSDKILWAPNISGWENFPLRQRLQEYFDIPVYIEYDGHTAILGEWWKGAGRGYETIAMVIIGTGVGGGLILDGKLLRGINRLAGAVGWFAMSSNWNSFPKKLGLGHWESLVAGPSIAEKAINLLPSYSDSSLHRFVPQDISAKTVFDYARKKDSLCCRVVQETGHIIGLGLSNIIDMINPEVIILGGSIGSQGDLLLAHITETVSHWAQPISSQSVRISTSQLGTDAGIFGAGYAAILRSTK